MSRHLRTTRPIARKALRCTLCDERIEVGERYVRSTFAGPDGVYDWTCHELCDAAAPEFYKGADEWWPYPDEFREFLANEWTGRERERAHDARCPAGGA